MKQYTEYNISQAIEAITRGQSIRRAALEWGVPNATIRNRLQGAQPHGEAAQGQQRLSKTQEDHLAQWVLTQAALGLPPTHSQLKTFAERILAVREDTRPLGKRWVRAFLKRNPSIQVQRSRTIDSKRVNGASTEIIRNWFHFLQIPAIKAIKPENRYNADEAGVMEGQGENGLVLGSAEGRSIQKKQPGSRVWTSFIECISATGVVLPPLVIFKGKSVQQ